MKVRYILIFFFLIFALLVGMSLKAPPLVEAASQNNFEKVKRLLKEGEHVEQEDTPGRSSLFFAAWNGNAQMCKLLIQKGANVNHQDVNGCTPLFDAAGQGHLEVIKILIKNGARKDHSCFGKTPFQNAIEHGHHHVALELKQ